MNDVDANGRKSTVLDLDKLDREGAPEPFEFILSGRSYIMTDPTEVDWQDLMAGLGNPHMFFRLVLKPEDRQSFFETTIPTWKMRKLMDRYQEHFGIPNLPNVGGLLR